MEIRTEFGRYILSRDLTIKVSHQIFGRFCISFCEGVWTKRFCGRLCGGVCGSYWCRGSVLTIGGRGSGVIIGMCWCYCLGRGL